MERYVPIEKADGSSDYSVVDLETLNAWADFDHGASKVGSPYPRPLLGEDGMPQDFVVERLEKG